MTGGEERARAQAVEAARWTVIARRDLATAAHCLRADPPLIESAAYFCQQTAEKLIKALLMAAAVPFPKSHDLKDLASRAMPHYPDLEVILAAAVPLTVWGVAYRYPAEEETAAVPPTLASIEQAIVQLHLMLHEVEQLIGQEGGCQ